jgi:HEAT repeats
VLETHTRFHRISQAMALERRFKGIPRVFSTTAGKRRTLISRSANTATRFRRWLSIFSGVLLAILVVMGIQNLGSRDAGSGPEEIGSVGPLRSRALPSASNGPGQPTAATDLAAASAEEPQDLRVARLMKDWRTAIVNRDPDVVESLDRIFAAQRGDFIPALMASAEADPEERVRSFSTRVLGKLRPTESIELLRRLLGDRSEYVRLNASWALGELADRHATAHLRQMQRRDPSPNVRRSAGESLQKIQGS